MRFFATLIFHCKRGWRRSFWTAKSRLVLLSETFVFECITIEDFFYWSSEGELFILSSISGLWHPWSAIGDRDDWGLPLMYSEVWVDDRWMRSFCFWWGGSSSQLLKINFSNRNLWRLFIQSISAILDDEGAVVWEAKRWRVDHLKSEKY